MAAKNFALVFSGMCCIALPVSAQKPAAQAIKVPAVVGSAVKKKFPTARRIEWKLKSDRQYEAEFQQNGFDVAVKYDSVGAWQETETTIRRSAIPAAVMKAAGNQFPDAKIIETQSVVKLGSPGTIYELHFDKGKTIAKAQFSSTGSLLSKSEKANPPPVK